MPIFLGRVNFYDKGLARNFFLFLHDDGSPVSIFSLTGSNANDGHLVAGCNGVKRLRTVSTRHK